MWKFVVSAAVLVFVMAIHASDANQVNLEGYFIAFQACEANKKKDSDNPGNVRLQPMHAYKMIARNSEPGSHYQVQVPGAPVTEARWVPMSCGAFAPQDALVMAEGGHGDGSSGTGPPRLIPGSIENVLAASWQPGFCATKPDKVECRSQTASRPDAKQFSLHGLWPDDLDNTAIFPCYCDTGAPVSCNQRRLPVSSIHLSSDVLDRLRVLMPGIESELHLHEWTKHGTCYEDDRTGSDAGADPDEYFGDALALLEQLNHSKVQDLFEANLGSDLTLLQIEQAFNEAFGHGAGDRVYMDCKKVNNIDVITELWIGLKGDITPDADLGALILAAPRREVSTPRASCTRGRVVKVPD
jgi:ribonuclease T2